GADQLDDAEGAHQVDEGFDLLFLTGDFDHDLFRRDVDDSAAEDFAELADVAALALGGADFDQHQVAFDVIVRADVLDADHGENFFELLAHLFQHAIVPDDDEGHARELGIFGLADGEAVDVEAARGEHAGNVREHAGDVLDGGRKDMPHGG